MFKRIALISLIIVALCGAMVFVLPKFLLPQAEVRHQISDQIMRWTGRSISFSKIKITSLFPRFLVELEDVTLESGNEAFNQPFIKMQQLEGELAFWSALWGDIKISDFKFIRPQIILATNKNGVSNWHLTQGEIAQKLQNAKNVIAQNDTAQKPQNFGAVNLELGSFEIEEGVILYQDELNQLKSKWNGVNLKIDYPELDGVASVKGNAIWNEEAVQIDGSAVAPLRLFAGGESDMVLLFDAKPLMLKFVGNVNFAAKGLIKGDVHVSSKSARHFATWAGYPMTPGSSFGAFELSGDVLGTITELKITDAAIKLDGNESTGILTVQKKQDELLKLGGTFALDELDLSPYFEQLDFTEKNAEKIIDLSVLDNFNLDIRLSANQVQAFGKELQNLAATVRVKDGRSTIDVGQASIFDGGIQMVLQAHNQSQGLAMDLKLNASDLNLEKIMEVLPPFDLSLAANGNLRIDVKAFGKKRSQFLQSMMGEFALSAKDGKFIGLNLKELVALNGQNTANLLEGVFKGETGFKNLILQGDIERGTLYLKDTKMEANPFIAYLNGKADLTRNALALHGALIQYQDADQNLDQVARQNFIIGGVFERPFFAPDFSQNFGN